MSNKILLIGDVHGKTSQYVRLLHTLRPERSIQLGDMGLGFRGVGLPPPGAIMPPGIHRFIRGNHDDPAKCKKNCHYMGDFGYHTKHELFYLGGAWSIDWMYRTEGESWWKDEELSILELNQAVGLYNMTKPRFVVTHEAPSIAAITMLSSVIPPSSDDNVTTVEKDHAYRYYKAKLGCVNTRTSQALQQMLEAWEPEIWVFGHYHLTKELTVPGRKTKFICLAELNTYELDTNG